MLLLSPSWAFFRLRVYLSWYSQKARKEFKHFGLQNTKNIWRENLLAQRTFWEKLQKLNIRVKRWHKKNEILNYIESHYFFFKLFADQVQSYCVNRLLKYKNEFLGHHGRDPFDQNSNRSDREKWSTSKGGRVLSKLFRLDRTDPLSFGPEFPEILVEWIAPPVELSFVGYVNRLI